MNNKLKNKLIAEKYNNILRAKKAVREVLNKEETCIKSNEFWILYISYYYIYEGVYSYVRLYCSKFYFKNNINKVTIDLGSGNTDELLKDIKKAVEKYNVKCEIL